MTSFLVTGLESSTTRAVSKIISTNLGIKKPEDIIDKDFEDNFYVSNDHYRVTHCSMPHGVSDYRHDAILDLNLYPDIIESEWDNIIVCTRDYNCSLQSKINNHQSDIHLAITEHNVGISYLNKIIGYDNVKLFSYETWRLFKDTYLEIFLNSLGINYNVRTQVQDVNKKYLSELTS